VKESDWVETKIEELTCSMCLENWIRKSSADLLNIKDCVSFIIRSCNDEPSNVYLMIEIKIKRIK
jgi:hypothetical protein